MHVFLEIEYIEVLEASEATQMKKQANRNYFALRHYRRALGRLAKNQVARRANDTVMHNARRDRKRGVRFARVPMGNSLLDLD